MDWLVVDTAAATATGDGTFGFCLGSHFSELDPSPKSKLLGIIGAGLYSKSVRGLKVHSRFQGKPFVFIAVMTKLVRSLV